MVGWISDNINEKTQPEYNILNQIPMSMQAKIKNGEVNYYSNSVTMD